MSARIWTGIAIVKKVVPLSLVALVDSIGARNDPAMYFTARIAVK